MYKLNNDGEVVLTKPSRGYFLQGGGMKAVLM